MKEDIFVVKPWGVSRKGTRTVAPYERDPDRIWIGNSQWYWDPADCTLTHAGDQIGTCYSVAPSALLYTELAKFGEKTPEGRIIQAPTLTWFEISNYLVEHPEFRFEFTAHPEKFEHFLAAGACIDSHGIVLVTPRSGDKGRDIVAQRSNALTIEEAKAYNAHRRVKAEQVRAFCYVAVRDHANYATITTTSDFAPRAMDEFARERSDFLQMVNGVQLVERIDAATTTQPATQLALKLYREAGVLCSPTANGQVLAHRQLRDYCGLTD